MDQQELQVATTQEPVTLHPDLALGQAPPPLYPAQAVAAEPPTQALVHPYTNTQPASANFEPQNPEHGMQGMNPQLSKESDSFLSENSQSCGQKRLQLPPRSIDDFDLIYVNANIYKVAHLHKSFPQQYRLEVEDTVVRRLKEKQERKRQEARRKQADDKRNTMKEEREQAKQSRVREKEELAKRMLVEKETKQRQAYEAKKQAMVDAQMANQKSVEHLTENNLPSLQPSDSQFEPPVDQVALVQEPAMAADTPREDFGSPTALHKQASRSSNRVIAKPDYRGMSKGEDQVNDNLAYPSENMRPDLAPTLAMLPPAKQNEKEAKAVAKKRGLILKSDVFGKCLEVLRLLQQNEHYRAMVKIAAQPIQPGTEGTESAAQEQLAKQELRKILEQVDKIGANLKDLQYLTTLDFAMAVRAPINELCISLPIKMPQLAPLPPKLHVYFEQIFALDKLANKEIVVSAERQLTQKSFSTNGGGEPNFHQSKLMHQMAKKLEEQQEAMKKLRTQLLKQEQRINKPNKDKNSLSRKTSTISKSGAAVPSSQPVQQQQVNMDNVPLDSSEQKFIEDHINTLNQIQRNGIFPIIEDCVQNNAGGGEEVVEFELEQLPPYKARQLLKYVQTQVKENNKKLRRKEADARRRQRKKEMEVQTRPISAAAESQPPVQQAPSMNKIKSINDVPEKKPTQPLVTTQQPTEPKSATPEATKAHTASARGTLPIDQSTAAVAQNSNPAAAALLTNTVPQPMMAHQTQAQMALESIEISQLSQLLQTSPNLPISAEKRRQISEYRAQQQFIQLLATQQPSVAASLPPQISGLNPQQIAMLQQLAPTLTSQQMQSLVVSFQQQSAVPQQSNVAANVNMLVSQATAATPFPAPVPGKLATTQPPHSQQVKIISPQLPAAKDKDYMSSSSDSSSDEDDYEEDPVAKKDIAKHWL